MCPEIGETFFPQMSKRGNNFSKNVPRREKPATIVFQPCFWEIGHSRKHCFLDMLQKGKKGMIARRVHNI
jgi:hypothetical protein